jgi:hypothetical protein
LCAANASPFHLPRAANPAYKGAATGSSKEDSKGIGCNAQAAPATVSGELRATATGAPNRAFWEGGAPIAMTREPGDLPVAVVFRSAGVRPSERGFPIDGRCDRAPTRACAIAQARAAD